MCDVRIKIKRLRIVIFTQKMTQVGKKKPTRTTNWASRVEVGNEFELRLR
jgi:hypothetical protein